MRQDSVLEESRQSRYARGGAPLTDPSQAVELEELLAAWDEATRG